MLFHFFYSCRTNRVVCLAFFLMMVSPILGEPPVISVPRLPEKLVFAGQTVPLERPAVLEQIDAMFTIMCTDNRGQMILWFKRANRILPIAKQVMEKAGLPQDLAYLAIAESDLLNRAKSPSGAYGIWQFMPVTAKEKHLLLQEGLDERGDFLKSATASASYLKELYNDLGQDWFLAMAAYNNGKTNIKKMMAAQHAKTYWDAVPTRETYVYVPRIVLIKTLFENPRLFGIDPSLIDSYPESASERVYLVLNSPVPFGNICDQVGVDYRSMLFLNPHIANPSYIKDVLLPANHSFFLDIPKGRGDMLRRSLRESKLID